MTDTTAHVEQQLLTALRTIRDHWPALLATPKGGTTGPASTDPVTGLDRRVSLRHEVTLTLSGWCRVIIEDRDLSHGLPLGTDTPGMIVLLERHARWFSGHEAAGDAAGELDDAAQQVRAAATPQRREWMPLGTCPLQVDTPQGQAPCGGQVRAYPDRDPHCIACGTEAVAVWWERVMFPDAEISELVTADELVLLLHKAFPGTYTKPSTIRQWIRRGVISPSGTDDKGRRLYDRAAVIYALTKRAEVAPV